MISENTIIYHIYNLNVGEFWFYSMFIGYHSKKNCHHHRESIRLSSSPSTISVPLRLQATWSRSVLVTMNWMTAFLWQLQARFRVDEELIRVMTKAVNELGLEWSRPEEPSRSRLEEWFLLGRHQALRQRSSPFFPEVHYELTKLWRAPYSSWIRPSASVALTSIDGAEEKGYKHLPPLDESVAAHLCSPTAIGWKARASHPSKPCKATSAVAGHAYSAAGQAALALHSMAVLQVFQAKKLTNEEASLDLASLGDLRSATDLALCATKATAQAIRRSMSSLIVLERHLWLTMTEMKEADKVPFLDATVLSGSLFGSAVEGFAEHFTEAQKSSQAMRHFLPKRTSSSSASSPPRPAPTQQTAKPMPTAPETRPPEGQRDRGCSRSARRYPFPEAPWTPAQDLLGSGSSEILLTNQAERGGIWARISLPLDPPASSLYCETESEQFRRSWCFESGWHSTHYAFTV